MQWNSAAEFFAMGGYGLYVWGSFGACALLMLVEPFLAHQRESQALAALRRERLAQELEHNDKASS
jgi:heme exporter protein D